MEGASCDSDSLRSDEFDASGEEMVGKRRNEFRVNLERPRSIPDREPAERAVIGSKQKHCFVRKAHHLILMTSYKGNLTHLWRHPRTSGRHLVVLYANAPTVGRPLNQTTKSLGQQLVAETYAHVGTFRRHNATQQFLDVLQPGDVVVRRHATRRADPSVDLLDMVGESALVEVVTDEFYSEGSEDIAEKFRIVPTDVLAPRIDMSNHQETYPQPLSVTHLCLDLTKREHGSLGAAQFRKKTALAKNGHDPFPEPECLFEMWIPREDELVESEGMILRDPIGNLYM